MTSDDPLRTWVLTHHYPSLLEPNRGAFVRALVKQWWAQGRDEMDVAVLAPEPLYAPSAGGFRRPTRSGPSDQEPALVRPVFPSFSARDVAGYSTARLTLRSFAWAARLGARQMPFEPDLLYAHFLFPAAWTASRMAATRRIPAVAALGESDFETWERQFGREALCATARGMDALLCVSQTNRDACLGFGVDDDRIVVIPNAVDTERFRPLDRAAARERLGLPQDRVILAFTGYFVERKGPLRVLEAMREVPEVAAVFVGDGSQRPEGDAVLHAGRVPHDQVPDWLSAADLFVLPTLAEGSPNAVLEAMACGLPVVSSDIPALREAVPPEAGRLVDPHDVAAIAAAVRELAGDEALRRRLGAAGRARAEAFGLDARARKIRRWLLDVQERFRREAGA